MDVSRMRYSRKKRLSYPGKSRIIWVTILVLLVLCCLLDVFYYKKYRTASYSSHILTWKRKMIRPGTIC